MANNVTFNDLDNSTMKLLKKLKADYKKEGKTAVQLIKDMVFSYDAQRKQGK